MNRSGADIAAMAMLGASLMLGLGSAVIIPVIAAPAPRGDLALVIAPPWVGAGVVIDGSGGRPVGPLQAPFATLARFEGAVPVTALKHGGAWAVLDGRRIALICGVESNV